MSHFGRNLLPAAVSAPAVAICLKSLLFTILRDAKEPTHCSKRVVPGVVVRSCCGQIPPIGITSGILPFNFNSVVMNKFLRVTCSNRTLLTSPILYLLWPQEVQRVALTDLGSAFHLKSRHSYLMEQTGKFVRLLTTVPNL